MSTQKLHLIYHALYVGLIAAITILICGYLSLKAWIAFFAWANYFLHGCKFKKSMKMLLAFALGISMAFLASEIISYLDTGLDSIAKIWVSSGTIFIVATILIYLECVKHWEEFVPASFLGTVLFFASGVTLENIFRELLFPLIIGVLAGLMTIIGREELYNLLKKVTKK